MLNTLGIVTAMKGDRDDLSRLLAPFEFRHEARAQFPIPQIVSSVRVMRLPAKRLMEKILPYEKNVGVQRTNGIKLSRTITFKLSYSGHWFRGWLHY